MKRLGFLELLKNFKRAHDAPAHENELDPAVKEGVRTRYASSVFGQDGKNYDGQALGV